MAYANNVIYIDTSTTPPIGVSIYDVQRALGESANDEGALCTSVKINKWARYKPERHDGIKPVKHGGTINTSRSRKLNRFGLEVPYCITDQNWGWYLNSMNGMVHDIITGYYEDAWKYNRPRGDRTPQGGVKEFYRLSDFARWPTDNTDPYYNTVYAKGYNHAAPLPFNSWMDMTGVTIKSSNERGTWYEINKQVTNRIRIFFQNSIGDDLHLQDFITLGNDGSGRYWRPVLQLYNEKNGTWYDKQNPDNQYIGSPITADEGNSLWYVDLPLNNYGNESNNAMTYYHLCVGIGLINDAQTSWGSGNKALFLLPFTDTQANLGKYPFYYQFTVVSHQERKLNVTALQFATINGWRNSRGTAPTFEIHTQATGVIGITMTITKIYNQAVTFRKQTDFTEGYMHIQASEMVNGGTRNIKYLTPSVGASPSGSQAPWAENINGIYVAAAASAQEESETVTLYATLDISDIPLNGYAQYNLSADTNSGTMADIGSFSIHKVNYFAQ